MLGMLKSSVPAWALYSQAWMDTLLSRAMSVVQDLVFVVPITISAYVVIVLVVSVTLPWIRSTKCMSWSGKHQQWFDQLDVGKIRFHDLKKKYRTAVCVTWFLT